MNSKQTKSKKAQLSEEYREEDGSLRCYWCRDNFPQEKLTLDHLKPKSKGGSNNQENLRLACFPCNNSRGNSLFPPQRIYNLYGMPTIP